MNKNQKWAISKPKTSRTRKLTAAKIVTIGDRSYLLWGKTKRSSFGRPYLVVPGLRAGWRCLTNWLEQSWSFLAGSEVAINDIKNNIKRALWLQSQTLNSWECLCNLNLASLHIRFMRQSLIIRSHTSSSTRALPQSLYKLHSAYCRRNFSISLYSYYGA